MIDIISKATNFPKQHAGQYAQNMGNPMTGWDETSHSDTLGKPRPLVIDPVTPQISNSNEQNPTTRPGYVRLATILL